MKLTIENNRIIATAETAPENFALMSVAEQFSGPQGRSNGTELPRVVRKTPLHKKTCEVCGRAFKGKIGLGTHRVRMHGLTKPVDAHLRKQKTHVMLSDTAKANLIRDYYDGDNTYTELAKAYKVAPSTVFRIVNGNRQARKEVEQTTELASKSLAPTGALMNSTFIK